MSCNVWLLNVTLHAESKILPLLIVLYCYMLAGSWLVAWLAGFPSLININMLSCASWPTTHNIVLLIMGTEFLVLHNCSFIYV
jgi:hypothetical protein